VKFQTNTKKILLKAARKTQTIVIGETHGVKENALFIKELVRLIGEKKVGFVGFEYPVQVQGKVNLLPLGKNDFLNEGYLKVLLEDGKFSEQHLETILGIKKKGIAIVCLDPSLGDWNKRDKIMFLNFRKAVKKFAFPKQKAIVVVGNLHAQTNTLKINNKKYVPFAAYLGNHLNINLIYESGSFFKKSLKDFANLRHSNQQVKIIGENKLNFYIPLAHPTIKRMKKP